MRCPTCGTENVQDSRFCGGCGAKLSSSRVAPTAKLSDDAVFPTPQPGPHSAPHPAQHSPQAYLPTPLPGSLQQPPQMRAPSPPSGGHRPMPVPDASHPGVTAPRGRGPISQGVETPSVSMPVPARNPTAMIAAVVILDLGLAAAGAMLLAKGLSAAPAAAPEAASPAPAPAPAPTPGSAAGSAAAPKGASLDPAPPAGSAAQVVDATTGAGPAPTLTAAAITTTTTTVAAAASGSAAKTDHRRSKTRKPTGATGPASLDPQDPYGADDATAAPPPPAEQPAAPSLASDIDRKAAASRGVFELCKSNAGEAHGTVQIAFQVLPDGRVVHVAAVENSTGNGQLASCLANTISAWQFEPRTGAAANFVRPFRYD